MESVTVASFDILMNFADSVSLIFPGYWLSSLNSITSWKLKFALTSEFVFILDVLTFVLSLYQWESDFDWRLSEKLLLYWF